MDKVGLVKNIIKKTVVVLPYLIAIVYSAPGVAGFLDMPEITETPTLERKSMLRDIDIPGVRDRNPDPNAGPRIAVSEFRIQGLVEYPEQGITRKAIDNLVEGIRFNLMAEGKLLESGYTLEELGELSDLLVDIEENTMERHVTSLEVQKLVWLIREQRTKRGITLGQIEAIADEITNFYRKRGFILAKAYIPKQQVREGIINLTLLLGMLGEVEVHGNEMYKDSTIKSVFDDMLTKPVTNDEAEEHLYLINDFPGIIVDGYFEPGYQVGDTRLNIKVKEEKRYHANVRLDNHGTDETGLYRFYGDLQVNNLLGVADLINLSVLEASKPSNTSYWRINYSSLFFSPRIKLVLDASKNQFTVDQDDVLSNAGLKINGDVFVYDASIQYIAKRSRTSNYNFELKYEDIESDLQFGDTPDVGNRLDEKLKNRSLLFNYDILEESARRLHQGNFRVTSGDYVFGAAQGQDESYTYYSAEYSLLAFWKVPLVDANTRVIFRTAVQYAGINLSTIVRAPLGGPTRARAFPVNLFSADDAIYAGVDWVFNSPVYRENIRPFVFLDAAYGIQYELSAGVDDTTGGVLDGGFGFQMSYGSNFSGTLQFAFPTKTHFSKPDITSASRDMRVVFDFQYKFF